MPNYILSTSRLMAKRHAREKRFKWYGRIAIFISIAFLVFMFSAIIFRGASAFQQTKISLDINFSESILDPSSSRDPDLLKRANYKPIVVESLLSVIPEVTERRDRNRLYKLLSTGAVFDLGEKVADDPSILGESKRSGCWHPPRLTYL